MKLEEAIKIWRETGRKIKPVDAKYYDQYLNFNIGNHVNSEWEVEPGPKKTVVMYKFAIKYPHDLFWNESNSFYKNEDHYLLHNKCSHRAVLKKLDYTATEFEV